MNPLFRLYCRTFQLGFRLALPLLPYREPKPLTGMAAIVPLLRRKKIRSVLLVTDTSIRGLGLTKTLEHELARADIFCRVYDGVVPNPTVANVEAAAARYRQARARAIIAVGGGSVMDCAKVAGARIARPRKRVNQMKGLLKILAPTPLLIVVPTTAGTGSEATLAAVITDPEAKHKYPINDFALIPDYAILDAEITRGLPPFLTATTGMDALTHAVEAYIGGTTTKLTQAMSEEAVVLIARYLRRAYEDGNDMEARRAMLRAAYCAGVSFTRSYVGYVHGIAHSLGGQYGVPHGLANAVILPYFLEEYGKSCRVSLAQLARIAGIVPAGLSDREAARRFIVWVREMNAAMGIPDKIPEIRREDIPRMAHHAHKESNPLYPVPKLMDERELARMYLRLMPRKESR